MGWDGMGRCQLVYAAFGDTDQFTEHAVAAYEAALADAKKNGIEIKALVITNPHNPLGTSTISRSTSLHFTLYLLASASHQHLRDLETPC